LLVPAKLSDLLLPKWKAAIEGDRVSLSALGKPVLIDDPLTVVDIGGGQAAHVDLRSGREAVRRLLSRARSLSYALSAAHAQEILARFGPDRRLNALIVGGGSIGPGIEDLAADPRVNLVAFDIYDGPNIDFIADGHSLPLADRTIDIVWIQAVLEHVADPRRVAAECERVLRPGGIVYAETPFMQQVHAERYDFTRFTALGHRMLFAGCDTVRSGVVDGPAVALIWSLRFFFAALFRSRSAGRLAGVLFTWLKLFDYVMPENQKQMGACSFYFMGLRRDEKQPPVMPKAMLEEYAGV